MKKEEIRVLAKKTVESPYLTELVGGIISEIAKEGKRRLTNIDDWSLEMINPEEELEIPADILEFLQKRTSLAFYADFVREEIVDKLQSSSALPMEEIVRYSTFFNMKKIKEIECCSPNLVRLALAVAVDDGPEGADIANQCPAYLEELFLALKIMSEHGDLSFLKAVAKVYKVFQTKKERS